MANYFLYKLEFNYDGGEPSDAGVYIQLRRNVPIYQTHIDKEDYDVLPEERKHPWLTSLFSIAGVTELSSRAYRVWLMKSPVYTWEEVLLPSLHYMKGYYGDDDIAALPGSGSVDGMGNTITSPVERRNR